MKKLNWDFIFEKNNNSCTDFKFKQARRRYVNKIYSHKNITKFDYTIKNEIKIHES